MKLSEPSAITCCSLVPLRFCFCPSISYTHYFFFTRFSVPNKLMGTSQRGTMCTWQFKKAHRFVTPLNLSCLTPITLHPNCEKFAKVS